MLPQELIETQEMSLNNNSNNSNTIEVRSSLEELSSIKNKILSIGIAAIKGKVWRHVVAASEEVVIDLVKSWLNTKTIEVGWHSNGGLGNNMLSS